MNSSRLMTKIICTIGPASSDLQTLTGLIAGGMNVARLNFSHGSPEKHFEVFKNIRRISRELGVNVAVLQDLPGIKIRVGKFSTSPVILKAGERFTLTGREIAGDNTIVSINYPKLPAEVNPGDNILLRDGLIKLEVLNIENQDINCAVIEGGELGNNQGVNLPRVNLSIPPLTAADVEYLKLGLAWGVDFVALSFVRAASDIIALKKIISGEGKDTPVIAKLEKPSAIENLEEIIEASGGVMIARGDLGIEMSPEYVPMLQKKIISTANRMGKLVITATQMLESMTNNPRPTRAEASDVANSIIDGTDAVMLSGETAMGKYPVETLQTMVKIIQVTEAEERKEGFKNGTQPKSDTTDAICQGAKIAASQIGAKYIIAFTKSGYTASSISKYRPDTGVIAFTPKEEIQRRLAPYWGIESRLMEPMYNLELLIEKAADMLKAQGEIEKGDKLVFIFGIPLEAAGITNILKIHEV